MSDDWPVRHPMWNGIPIFLGDLVKVEDTEPHSPPSWEEVREISFDPYDGTHSFRVAGQYWTVYLTVGQAIDHADYDDRCWIIDHKSLVPVAGALVVEGGQSNEFPPTSGMDRQAMIDNGLVDE